MSIQLNGVSDSTGASLSASSAAESQTSLSAAGTFSKTQASAVSGPQPIFIEQTPKKTVDFSSQVAANQQALEQALEELNQQASQSKLSVGFNLDKASGMQYVQVTNVHSGEVVLQYPSSKMLDIAASIDQLKGMLYNKKV
jgi:uncharacterized FlaG/YvyC family protein